MMHDSSHLPALYGSGGAPFFNRYAWPWLMGCWPGGCVHLVENRAVRSLRCVSFESGARSLCHCVPAAVSPFSETPTCLFNFGYPLSRQATSMDRKFLSRSS
jgi:hypothetical protein